MAQSASISNTIRVRPVTLADAQVLFEWVNDAEVRRLSFTGAAVSWPEHLAWLRSKLAEGAAAWLWLAETAAGAPLGQIRFEAEGGEAVMSISIDRRYRRQGFGSQVILEGCRRLFEESPLKRIVAYVKPENAASQAVLERAGFVAGESVAGQRPQAQAWRLARQDRS